MPSDPVKAFWFLFYLQITSGTETCKERSSQMRKGRKRERKNDSQMQWPNPRCSGKIAPLSSQFMPPISLFLDLPFPFELSLIVAAPRRSRLQHCVAWSRLRLRHVISPFVEPSCLSLFLLLLIWLDLMIFFSGFCLCFCIEEWIILYICLAVEKMWESVNNK